MHAHALVNPAISTNLISSHPVISQQDLIILTTTEASVMPKSHPITNEATRVAKRIATFENGVYVLNTAAQIKPKPMGSCTSN